MFPIAVMDVGACCMVVVFVRGVFVCFVGYDRLLCLVIGCGFVTLDSACVIVCLTCCFLTAFCVFLCLCVCSECMLTVGAFFFVSDRVCVVC